jgi:hypothetical protein
MFQDEARRDTPGGVWRLSTRFETLAIATAMMAGIALSAGAQAILTRRQLDASTIMRTTPSDGTTPASTTTAAIDHVDVCAPVHTIAILMIVGAGRRGGAEAPCAH